MKQFCLRGHDRFLPNALTLDDRCKLCKKINDRRWVREHLEWYRQHQNDWRSKNVEWSRKWHNNWIAMNPDKAKAKHLKYKYKISLDTFNKMFKQQKGKCMICSKHQDELKKSLCVDHNHL